MTFLKQGKTNWKYLLIVVILAVIVGGGALYYCWLMKKEIPIPSFLISKEISEQKALELANNILQQKCQQNFIEVKKIDWTTGGPEVLILKESICPTIGDYKKNKIWRTEKPLDENRNAIGFVGLDGKFVCVYALDRRAAPGIMPLDEVCREKKVTITTDKTEYERGETVKITVRNNLDKKIGVLDVFNGIERFENGKWVNLWSLTGYKCSCDPTCYFGGIPEIEPHESMDFEWNQKMWTYCNSEASFSDLKDSTFVFALPGEYRVAVKIDNEKNILYSNEFTIKEMEMTCDEKCKSLGYASGICRPFPIIPKEYEKRCKFEEGETDIGHTFDCNPFEFNEEGEPVGGGGKACCCRAKEGQEVTVSTDKTEYWQEEAVKITIINNGKEPIYLSPYNLPGGHFYSISQFINGSWKEISLSCGPTCVCSTDDYLSCVEEIMPAPYFIEFKSPLTSEWQQTRCVFKNEMCGNESYAKGVFEQVETGRYKIKFCYWDKKDIDLTKDVNYAPQDKKKCIEKEFTIKEKQESMFQSVFQYCYYNCDDHFLCGNVYKCSNNIFKIIPVVTDIGVHYIDRDGKMLAKNCGGYGAGEMPSECFQFYVKDFRCEDTNLCKQ